MKFRTEQEAAWCTWEKTYDLRTGNWRESRPVTDRSKCRQCGWCYLLCPANSVKIINGYCEPDLNYCKGCGVCAKECPAKAVKMVPEKVADNEQ